MKWLIGCGALLLVLLGMFHVEQHLLLTRNKQIPMAHLPPEWDGTKILQISDLHHRSMGKDNCRISRKAAALQPDYIVITGDLISRDIREFSYLTPFLRRLRKICPVYLCPGNHELDLPEDAWQSLQQILSDADCRMLSNETISLEKSGAALYLSGAKLKMSIYRDENRGFRHLQPYSAADLAADLEKPPGCTILLAHNPLLWETYAAWGADLTLSGHIHGGVVRLPFVGGLLSPERKFFPRYDKGCYQKGTAWMYVSGGIGKPRLFNPPELNLLYLNSVQK